MQWFVQGVSMIVFWEVRASIKMGMGVIPSKTRHLQNVCIIHFVNGITVILVNFLDFVIFPSFLSIFISDWLPPTLLITSLARYAKNSPKPKRQETR